MEQVQVAWERVTSARAGYEASLVTINANEVALRGLILENRSGLRTTLDVLDGERELLAARLTTYQARQQYYLACYALLQVTGQLTAAGLGLADAAPVAAPTGASAARSASPATPQLFDRR